MSSFLPRLTVFSDWILVGCMLWCLLLAARGGSFARNAIAPSLWLLAVPWLILGGTAADHMRHYFASLELEPSGFLEHSFTLLAETIPIVGGAALVISLLLLGVCLRSGTRSQARIAVLAGVLPASLLTWQGVQSASVYDQVSAATGGVDSLEVSQAMQTGIATSLPLVALLLFLTVVIPSLRSSARARTD